MTQYTKAKFDEKMVNQEPVKLGDTIKHPDGSVEEVIYVQEGSHICGLTWKTKSKELKDKEAKIQAEREAFALRQEALNQIASRKKELADSDFRVIKCYEYSLVNKELPYNVEELNTQRDKLRAEINALESGLAK